MRKLLKALKLKRRIITWLAGLHFLGNPTRKLKVVGVTGTNGKTTTATLLYRVATALGYKAGLIGTVENIINGAVKGATLTTPDPVSLYRLLNEMARQGCEYVFMEVSSHALDQNRTAGINFFGGIFTNLTHDHLDYHKDLDTYFRAKQKLFKKLSATAFALSNADDDYGKKMLDGVRARKFLYEFSNVEGPATLTNSFRAELLKSDINGTEIKIGDTVLKSQLLGKFNAYNILAVWSACKLLGFDMEKVKGAIENVEPPRGRFEHFMSPDGVLVVIDYAHTPDAVEKILVALRELKGDGNKLISLIGCGGDRDPMKRPKMGKLGATLSDTSILTSDNPRTEDPNKILSDMQMSLSPEEQKKVKVIENRRVAIAEAVKLAKAGDIILAAGKGHENYQEINGVRHHFDDLEEFRKILG